MVLLIAAASHPITQELPGQADIDDSDTTENITVRRGDIIRISAGDSGRLDNGDL